MNPTTPAEGNLMFYVVNNLNHEQMSEKLMIERRLTLPQATARIKRPRLAQRRRAGRISTSCGDARVRMRW